MYDINSITTGCGVNIISINDLNFYQDKDNKIMWNMLNALPVADYSVIELTRVNTVDFVRYAQAAHKLLLDKQLPNKNIVLTCVYESYSAQTYSTLITTLALLGVTHILILDGGRDINIRVQQCFDDLHVSHLTTSFFFKLYFEQDHVKISNVNNKTRYFSSLARLPRYERFKFTNLLLENRNVFEKGIVSCAWSEYDYENKQWLQFDHLFKNYIPETLKDEYPVSIGDHDKDQHNITKDKAKCCINVVLEGEPGFYFNSYNYKVGINRTSVPNERDFFTEKTAKAFVASQLPLFVAGPGYVQYLRELGFDVFDDFFDHGYDKVDDIDIRIQMVYEQLEQKCMMDLHEIKQFMKINRIRFERNHAILKQLGSVLDDNIFNYVSNNF